MISLKPMFDNLGLGETYVICSLLIIPLVWSARKILNLKLY